MNSAMNVVNCRNYIITIIKKKKKKNVANIVVKHSELCAKLYELTDRCLSRYTCILGYVCYVVLESSIPFSWA